MSAANENTITMDCEALQGSDTWAKGSEFEEKAIHPERSAQAQAKSRLKVYGSFKHPDKNAGMALYGTLKVDFVTKDVAFHPENHPENGNYYDPSKSRLDTLDFEKKYKHVDILYKDGYSKIQFYQSEASRDEDSFYISSAISFHAMEEIVKLLQDKL
jgi:hypothetical protein